MAERTVSPPGVTAGEDSTSHSDLSLGSGHFLLSGSSQAGSRSQAQIPTPVQATAHPPMQTYFLLGGREVAEVFEMKDSCLPVVENRGTPHSQDPQTYLIRLSMVYFRYTQHASK